MIDDPSMKRGEAQSLNAIYQQVGKLTRSRRSMGHKLALKFSLLSFLLIWVTCSNCLHAGVYGYADLDGDGYLDEIDLSGFTVAVFHPRTSTTNYYEHPDLVDISISNIANTDGTPGNSIIVLYTKAYTLTKGVEVIHDRTGVRNTYEYPGATALSISSLADTDGTPGQKIITLASEPSQVSIDVIHDGQATRNSYPYPDTTGLSIAKVVNTDGMPGNEIVVLYTKASTTAKAIDVIHDRTGVRNTYEYPGATALSISYLADTDGTPGQKIITLASEPSQVSIDVIHDGQATRNSYPYPDTIYLSIADVEDTDGIPGNEIVVLYTKAYTTAKAIDVIHDATESRNTYDFGVVAGLSINDITDYDGVPGAEICVHWWAGTNSGDKLIVDRTVIPQ